jgi:hypothetical protein
MFRRGALRLQGVPNRENIAKQHLSFFSEMFGALYQSYAETAAQVVCELYNTDTRGNGKP